jgi:hypothetical protein
MWNQADEIIELRSWRQNEFLPQIKKRDASTQCDLNEFVIPDYEESLIKIRKQDFKDTVYMIILAIFYLTVYFAYIYYCHQREFKADQGNVRINV